MKLPETLKKRHVLSLSDLSDTEMLELVSLAAELKAEKHAGRQPGNRLRGKSIALVFEKSSTRTRCAATVAAADEGAHVEYLGKGDIHLGKKESVADTARVLGRMFDGILFRGYSHETVVQLAKFAGIPVWNGLTDEFHPTQILADLQTAAEAFPKLAGLKTVFLGDGRNNICNSLMLGCAKAGINFVNCCPPELTPEPGLVECARTLAATNNCSIEINSDPATAVAGANVIYTDVWVSMGEEDKFAERLNLLRPYQVDMNLMRQTGNLENGQMIFLHCLPAFHNNETEVTRETGPLEVTDDVFEAPFSKVFDQAENRVHTTKAVMLATLA